MNTYSAFVCERRGLLALLIVAISVVACFGLTRLDLDENPRDFFRRPGPDWDRLERFFADFGPDDAHAVAMATAPDLFTPEAMSALRSLVKRIESLPEVAAVDSLLRARRQDLPAAPLVPSELTVENLVRARQRAVTHPSVAGLLLSSDGDTAFLVIHFRDTVALMSRVAPQVAALRETVAAAGPPLTVHLAGTPVARLEMVEATRLEIFRSVAISGLITTIAALLAFRSVAATITAMAAPTLGTAWTLGVIGLFNENLSGLNAALPNLIFVIAFADSVHLIAEFRHGRARGLSRLEAVRAMMQSVGNACVLMVFTTVVGFGSLAIAELDSIRRFGIVSALGTVLGFAAVLTVLPWLLGGWLGERIGMAKPMAADDDVEPADWTLSWARVLLRHPHLLVFGAVLGTAGLAVIACRLQAEIRWDELLPNGSAVSRAIQVCDDKFGGSFQAAVVMEWPPGADDSAAAGVLREVQDLFGTDGFLRACCSGLNLAAGLRRNGTIDEVTLADFDRIPKRLRERFVRPDLNRAVVTAYAPDKGSILLLPEYDRIERSLRDIESRHPGYRCELTGTAVIACRNIASVITDASRSLLLSCVVIIATMMLVFRSVRLGLICVIPTLFPVVVAAASLVVIGQPLRLAGAIAFSICLGLADDNTIHFVTRFRQESLRGAGIRPAIERTLASCGPAMVIMGFTLAAGLVPLLSSVISPLRTFAQLTITAIVASVVADLVILPPLLMLFAAPARLGWRQGPGSGTSDLLQEPPP